MRRFLITTCLLNVAPTVARTQTENAHRGQEYFFVAPGGVSSESTPTVHIGGGGSSVFYKGLAAGWELGYIAPTERLKDGMGILSGNGLYRFPIPAGSRRLEPFVTGGYSLAFRSSVTNGFNFGGGLNYWFSDGIGLRIEFRDHRLLEQHFYGFRTGLVFGR